MDRIESIEKIQGVVVLYRLESEAGRRWQVHSATLKKLGLKTGSPVDADALSLQVDALESAEAREAVLRSLSRSGRSRKSLVQLLIQKHFAESSAEAAVAWAVENGWLDEAGQMEAMVDARIGREGTARVKQRLIQKGYDRDAVEAMLQERTPDEAQYQGAYDLACRKASFYRQKDPARWKDRLGAWLYGKGYSGDTIRKVLRALE